MSLDVLFCRIKSDQTFLKLTSTIRSIRFTLLLLFSLTLLFSRVAMSSITFSSIFRKRQQQQLFLSSFNTLNKSKFCRPTQFKPISIYPRNIQNSNNKNDNYDNLLRDTFASGEIQKPFAFKCYSNLGVGSTKYKLRELCCWSLGRQFKNHNKFGSQAIIAFPLYSISSLKPSESSTNMSSLASLSPRKRKQMLKKRDRNTQQQRQKQESKQRVKVQSSKRQTTRKILSSCEKKGSGNNHKNNYNTEGSSKLPPTSITLEEKEFDNREYYLKIVKAYKKQRASKKILELYDIAIEHNCITTKLLKLSVRVQRDLSRLDYVGEILNKTVDHLKTIENGRGQADLNNEERDGEIVELKVEVISEYIRSGYFDEAKEYMKIWFGVNLDDRRDSKGGANSSFYQPDLDIVNQTNFAKLFTNQCNVLVDIMILFSISHLKRSKTLSAWYYFTLIYSLHNMKASSLQKEEEDSVAVSNMTKDNEALNLSLSPPPLEYINSLLKQLAEKKDLSRILACFDTFSKLGVIPDSSCYNYLSNTAVTNVEFVTGAVSMDTLPSSSSYGKERKDTAVSLSNATLKEDTFDENINPLIKNQQGYILPNQIKEAIFIGRSNVGKSSLINMIMNRKDLAYVSKKPGKTRQFNYFLVNNRIEHKEELKGKAGNPKIRANKNYKSDYIITKREPFYLVDLPGFGYAKTSRDLRESWADFQQAYLSTNTNLKLVFHLIDSRHGPLEADLQMMQNIQNDLLEDAKYICILTKTDKKEGGKSQVSPTVLASLDKALKDCGFQGAKFPSSHDNYLLQATEASKYALENDERIQVLFTSSQTRLGLDQVWKELSVLF